VSRPHRYVTVDVFTDRVFGGNPLAVVLDAEGLTTAQMQSIAAEFNYPRPLRAAGACAGAHCKRPHLHAAQRSPVRGPSQRRDGAGARATD